MRGGRVRVVVGSETGRFERCFNILEELGRETWTDFLGRRKVLPVVVDVEVAVAVAGFAEADSSCFPFHLGGSERKVGDVVGCSFDYHANYISNRLRRKGYINLLDQGYRCTA